VAADLIRDACPVSTPALHSPSRPRRSRFAVGTLGGRLLATLFLAAAGCTGVTHTPVDDADHGTGIRYYQTSPYLLVNSDGRGGLQWRILYLPDQTKKMMATPYTLASRTEMTLQFHNGTLVGTAVVGDSTEVPRAILAAVQAAASTLAGTAALARSGADLPSIHAPYLYKIIVEGSKVTFIGTVNTDPIVVSPVLEPK
jgi:hypothetical protein